MPPPENAATERQRGSIGLAESPAVRRCWGLLLLFLLAAPAWAQQQNPYLQFITQVIARAQANDMNGAVALIQGNPEMAAQTFEIMFFAYPQAVDPTQKQTAKIYCNLVARVFEQGGNATFVGRLRDAGMLVELTGTPPPPASTPAPAPAPAAGATGSLEATWSALHELYMVALRSTLRTGNFVAARRQADAYLRWQRELAPLVKSQRGVVFATTLRAAVELSAMDALGVHEGAGEVANVTLDLVRKRGKDVADHSLFAYTALAVSGRKSGLPGLVDTSLTEGLKLKSAEDNGRALRFVLLSFQAERDLEKDPEMPLEAVLARHDAAWAEIRDQGLSRLNLGCVGRWCTEAARFWFAELERRERLQRPGSPAARRLGALRVADEGILLKLAVEAIQNVEGRGSLNPEFMAGCVAYTLDRAETLREEGELDKSRELLTQAAGQAAGLLGLAGKGEQLYSGYIQAEVARLQPQVAALPIHPGFETLSVSLLPGEAMQLVARSELCQVRQELAENPGKLPADRFEKVRGHLGKAQELQQKSRAGLGAQGLDQVGLTILAVLFQQRGEGWQAHAAQMLTEQLALARALNERPGLIAALTYEGELRAAAGNPGGAIQSLTEAVELAEKYIGEAGATQAGATRIRERYRRAYELLVQLLLEAGRQAEAFSYLGRMQQMDSIAWSAPQLGYRRDLAGLTRLRGETTALEQEVVGLKAAQLDARPAETLLAGKKAQYRQALEEVRKANPELENLLAVHPVQLESVQKALPADTVLVQYFPAPEALYIFVADKLELKIRKLAVKADDLRVLAREARAAIIQAGRQGGGATPPALGSLHKVLIDPVEADLQPTVVFIPTGFLDYVPFPALTNGAGEFLIERKRCATLLKSSEVERIGRARAKDGKVVALGDPDGSLPEAGKEVTQIAQLFPGGSTKVGAGVTKADVQVSPGTGMLHLATHGVLDHKNPAASYLVLGGNQNLMMAEIYGLKLKGMRLVTLSACDTAVGEREPGRNLTTLADAFGVAGSPTVIASLWKVSDASTRELMVGFYKGVKEGKSLAEAMQQAQRQLVSQPKFRNPFYWAPFVLLGDWR